MAGGENQFIVIAGKAKPADFRRRIESLLVKLQAVKPPESMKQVHAQVLEVIQTARTAAIYYERMTAIGEFDELTKREIINKACDLMRTVQDRRAELEKSLLPRTGQQKI